MTDNTSSDNKPAKPHEDPQGKQSDQQEGSTEYKDGYPLGITQASKIFAKRKAWLSLDMVPLPPQLVDYEEAYKEKPPTHNKEDALRTAAAARFLAHRGGFTQSAQSLMALIVAAFLAAGLAIATTEKDTFPFNLVIHICAGFFLVIYVWLMYIDVQAKRLEQYAFLWEKAVE